MTDKELQKEKNLAWSKRIEALDLLNESINVGEPFEMEKSFRKFLHAHKQWLLIDDALCAHRLEHGKR